MQSLSEALAEIDLIDHPDGITAGVEQAAEVIAAHVESWLTTERTAG
ncbi:hypothetical protein [Nocardiopsis dassonvillei]